jgi:hypothetical protein
MSAPGGFWNRASQDLAREAGYTLVGNSVPWWNRPEQVAGERQVNRVALLAQFGPNWFTRILARDHSLFLLLRLGSLALALPKVVRGRLGIRPWR